MPAASSLPNGRGGPRYSEGIDLSGESLNSTQWCDVPSLAATISSRRQDLLEQQVAILTMIARDESFVDTIGAVIALTERLEPGSIAGVTIAGRTSEM
jgi:hypothetical protein